MLAGQSGWIVTAAVVSNARVFVELRRERVAELTRAGMSAREIADRERIAPRTVVRIRAAVGVARVVTDQPLSEDEYRQAADLLADGCSYSEVARTLGRAQSTIRRRFPGMGWPPGEGARLGQQIRWANYRVEQAGWVS